MDKRKIKAVNFSEEFEREFKYVQQLKGNGTSFSYFVCQLIRQHIDNENNKHIDTLKDIVRQTVQEELRNIQIPQQTIPQHRLKFEEKQQEDDNRMPDLEL